MNRSHVPQQLRLVLSVAGSILILTMISITGNNRAEFKKIYSPRQSQTTAGTVPARQGCQWQNYACDMYYYWPSPDAGFGNYFNMRFTPEACCTLGRVALVLYRDYPEFSNSSGQGINVFVWNDDGSGLPGSVITSKNVLGANLVFDPDTLFVDFTDQRLVLCSDFHVGFSAVNATTDNFAVISDSGSCGTLRSSSQRDGTWSTILDRFGTDVNFCVQAELCFEPAPDDSFCCEIAPFDTAFTTCPGTPVELWHWQRDPVILTKYNQVCMTPVVADLENDNRPEVFFITYDSVDHGMNFAWSGGVLRVISGIDGSPTFSYPDEDLDTLQKWNMFYGASALAVGDVDADGLIEIIGARRGNPIAGDFSTLGQGLICLDVQDLTQDGDYTDPGEVVVKPGWPSAQPGQGIGTSGIWIANIDRTGLPEIGVGNCVLNADGTLRWMGSVPDASPGSGSLSFAADIVPGGDLEIVNGKALYNSNGQTIWSLQSPIGSGHAGVANFDADSDGEVVLVHNGKVSLIDYSPGNPASPTVVWTTQLQRAGGTFVEDKGGPPCIAEAWGASAGVEIGVAAGNSYFVLGSDGTIISYFETQDWSSEMTGSTMFDFDYDGQTEILYNDECRFRILHAGDPSTVSVFSTPNSSRTAFEYPVVADVNANGHADIIFAANDAITTSTVCFTHHGVRAWKDIDDCWINTRRIWNQHAYSITHVNDDGSIPTSQVTNWLTNPSPPPPIFNNFRTQGWWHEDPTHLPELCVHELRPTQGYRCDGYGNTVFTATVVNNGPITVAPGVNVSFYISTGFGPDNCEHVSKLGTVQTTGSIAKGQTEDVNFVAHMLCNGKYQVDVCVDDDGFGVGKVAEMDETNNCCCKLLRVACRGEISGKKFKDNNLNGDCDLGDAWLSGWMIRLWKYNPTTGITSPADPVSWKVTDFDGNFKFDCLRPLPPPWVYLLTEVYDPLLWFQTTPPSGRFIVPLQEHELVQSEYFGNAERTAIDCPFDLNGMLCLVTLCANQETKSSEFIVNKPSATSNQYRWYLIPEPTGTPYYWCTSGNLDFVPRSGDLDFSSTNSITVPFVIDRRSAQPAMVPGDRACYKLVVVDQSNGDQYCAYAWITVTEPFCGEIVYPDKSAPSTTSAVIHNTGSQSIFHYEFAAVQLDGSPDPYVRVNGLAPGMTVVDSVTIPTLDSVVISVNTTFTESRPNEIHKLMLRWNLDANTGFDDALSAPLLSYLCGDADGNALVNISDAVYLIYYIFAGGPPPRPLSSGDSDCNGLVTISDVVYLINYIFIGGAAPCAACP